MTHQLPLLVENYDQAIQATVLALGGNKVVGHLLWPAKEPDEAGKQLSNALNRRKRDVLDPQELALIRREARKKGIHTMATYEMRDAGYADPTPVEPEDERAALQRSFVEHVQLMKRLFDRMQQSGIRTDL